MRPLLRVGARVNGRREWRSEVYQGQQRGPSSSDRHKEPKIALQHHAGGGGAFEGRASEGAGSSGGGAGAGTWVRSCRPAPVHFRVQRRGSWKRLYPVPPSDPRRPPVVPRPGRYLTAARPVPVGRSQTPARARPEPSRHPNRSRRDPRRLALSREVCLELFLVRVASLLLLPHSWQLQEPRLKAKGNWEPQPCCRT